MENRLRFACLLVAGAIGIQAQQRPSSLASDAKGAWAGISGNIVKAAEKMPEENYSFRPAESVRTFAQVIGHVTDANYLFCAPVQTDKKEEPGAEEKLSAKSDLVTALKASVGYCNAAFEQVSDSRVGDMVKLFGRDRAKLSILYMNVAHSNEHYGNIVTYLRLKGIVPPSSEPRPKAAASTPAIKLYFDRGHGELPLPSEMAELAKNVNLEIQTPDQSISTPSLEGIGLLYLRAPSKTFVDDEKRAIVGYVQKGGSLLLVLDEEKRQSLQGTGVNDFLSPFGMRLTPETEYFPNPGAIALAGEINKADREIPYDGGRAVEGGTPFAFQLDKNGKPGPAYGAWKKVDGGGRIIVLAEGMASLFMGTPTGRRLVAVNQNTGNTYFGKDSAIFMEEVITWLVKKNA